MLVNDNSHQLRTELKNPTLEILRTIGSPLSPNQGSEAAAGESGELYRLAAKNKVSLLFLKALEQQGRLNELKQKYEEECIRYLNLFKAAGKASYILESANIEYAIFKTIKPYPAVPSDIDIIILGEHGRYKKAVETLLKADYLPSIADILDVNTLTSPDKYKQAVEILTKPTYEKAHISPTGVGLRDTGHDCIVDLQKEVAASYIIYMDKDKFQKHLIKAELSGEGEARILIPELDLAVIIAHSLMEQTFHLGEFYSFAYYLSKMDDSQIDGFINIIRENNIRAAAKACATISARLHREAYGTVPEKIEFILGKLGKDTAEAKALVRSNFKTPHRYRALTVAGVLTEKLRGPRFRKSVVIQLTKMLNPKLARLVLHEITAKR